MLLGGIISANGIIVSPAERNKITRKKGET